MNAAIDLGFRKDRLQLSLGWEETDDIELKPRLEHHILPVGEPRYRIWQATWLRLTARCQWRYK